jgi:hypothetical protein
MNMNAAQVIQEIDSMTEQDQGEVIAYLRQMEGPLPPGAG